MHNVESTLDQSSASGRLSQLRSVISRYNLSSLSSSLEACEELIASQSSPLDVAVLGQFKSGKSSLLNTILGADILPVGVLPVTAIITRISGSRDGEGLHALVTYLDGSTERIDPSSIGEFVSEKYNPANSRKVSVVDVYSTGLSSFPGLRFVDTPGLGSIYIHNTQSTEKWLPRVAVAIMAVSCDRPFSEEDRRLIKELRNHAPRIALVLTKVDLLSDPQRREIHLFVEDQLRAEKLYNVPIVFFSIRDEPQRWVGELRDKLLRPIVDNIFRQREITLAHKLTLIAVRSREYLTVALRAAEQKEADRARLSAAVLDESVKEAVVRDELALTARRMHDACRPAFQTFLNQRRSEVETRILTDLANDLSQWRGNLAKQTERYQAWLEERLAAEIGPIANDAAEIGNRLLNEAEERFRRIVEAFRDRLSRNISDAAGVKLSTVTWVSRPVVVKTMPIWLGQVFSTQWPLLWWLIPMPIFGGLFRQHCLQLARWELEKHISRLVSHWSELMLPLIDDLQVQALNWVRAELSTLSALLDNTDEDASKIRDTLDSLLSVEIESPKGDLPPISQTGL